MGIVIAVVIGLAVLAGLAFALAVARAAHRPRGRMPRQAAAQYQVEGDQPHTSAFGQADAALPQADGGRSQQAKHGAGCAAGEGVGRQQQRAKGTAEQRRREEQQVPRFAQHAF